MFRLLHTAPFEKLATKQAQKDIEAYAAGHTHVKTANDAETVHSLAGNLYLSKSGWLLLDVPNALVRGAYDALNEPGAELPLQSHGTLNAHVSIMRPEEIEQLGGPDKITERGHMFHYTLGPVQEVVPSGWDGISKVWFIQVKSKELQDLRKSYGLTPRPNGNKFDFHITIGRRRKKVLQHNDVNKAAAHSLLTAAALAALKPEEPEESEDDEAKEELAEQDEHLNAIRENNPVIAPMPEKLAHEGKMKKIELKVLPEAPVKIRRDAFLYLDPKGDHSKFAQCESCLRWTGAESNTCGILGPDIEVTGDMSCGMYIHGKPDPSTAGQEDTLFTPEQVGLVKRAVRCENCIYYEEDEGECELFCQLNHAYSDVFDLDDHVDAHGCCNSHTPKVKDTEKVSEAKVDVPLPDTDQNVKFNCGPAAMKAILDYYGEKDDLDDMTQDADADPDGGTTPEKLIQLAKAHGMNVRAQNNMTTDNLRAYLDLKRPVLVNMQAWGDNDLYKKDRAGHYLVVIGYDDKNFYFEDPSIHNGERGEMTHEELDSRWHDTDKTGQPTDHFGIVVWRNQPPEETSTADSTEKISSSDVESPPKEGDKRERVHVDFENDKGEHLVQDSKNHEGKVHLLAGHVEGKESERHAAKREMEEELGIDLKKKDLKEEAHNVFKAKGITPKPGDYHHDPDEPLHVWYDKPKDHEIIGPKPFEKKSVLDLLSHVGLTAPRSLSHDEDKERKKIDWKKWLLPGGVAAGAGIGAAALHPSTSTMMPEQVTRFPTKADPYLIRGRVGPDSPASIIDNTGAAYLAAGSPGERVHIQASGLNDLVSGMKAKLKPGQKLGLLELFGHGSPEHQDIGSGEHDVSSIGNVTAGAVAKGIRDSLDPKSTILLGGCNTGLCLPGRAFGQRLADQTGAEVNAARGYTLMPDDNNLDTEVHHVGRNPKAHPFYWPGMEPKDFPPGWAEHVNRLKRNIAAAEDSAYTVYKPGQPQTIQHDPLDPSRDDKSKSTWFKMPFDSLAETAYNIGKPSAILGALGTPFIPNERAALGTAIGASALASPMAISEIVARLAESRAKEHYSGSGNYLANQAKALPHVGLAAMPLLAYGAAKLLGRWKDEKKRKEHIENVALHSQAG